ncbi:hypothetical protein QR680_018909 [Steinernema hermaphroditum]|uniref:Coatomer subunit beta n=1 Tax=Steinernema hermaphroditum TaxID=289476 RepID=A0AA39LRH1_9BILA|nr:hypothetical protein QR680_018909 [Steinernema hermaphroditum]
MISARSLCVIVLLTLFFHFGSTVNNTRNEEFRFIYYDYSKGIDSGMRVRAWGPFRYYVAVKLCIEQITRDDANWCGFGLMVRQYVDIENHWERKELDEFYANMRNSNCYISQLNHLFRYEPFIREGKSKEGRMPQLNDVTPSKNVNAFAYDVVQVVAGSLAFICVFLIIAVITLGVLNCRKPRQKPSDHRSRPSDNYKRHTGRSGNKVGGLSADSSDEKKMAGEQPCYTLIHIPNDYEAPSEQELKYLFEHGDTRLKTDALKKLIMMLMNGDQIGPTLMMYVIRFCLPSHDHAMKKLMLLFWEVVPKTSADGQLLREMILVCDAYRKDLQHANEYVRGSTLRFLCKLKEPELLEPLMPPIRACLEHKHHYVRRNAVLAIYTIYQNFEFLIPDAPELVSNFLETEQDASCKRNAFMMLLHVDQARALDYLSGCIEQVTSFCDILQLIIVELIYKVCISNRSECARFIRCVYKLLKSQSAAVRYEAASTLVTLTSAPSAVKAAASVYIELIVKESDNNVKLIVLDKLIDLKESVQNERVLQELVMDILRVLSATDHEVRKKALSLALELVSSRNVNEMVMVLRKEMGKSRDGAEGADQYRQLLVRTLHRATMKFSDVAEQIIPVLIEFLSDSSESAALDVLDFLREAVHRLPGLRSVIIDQLHEVFPSICNANVFGRTTWLLGEFADTPERMVKLFSLIKTAVGPLPLVDAELREREGDEPVVDESAQASTDKANKPIVTADGTYATQSAVVSDTKAAQGDRPLLRNFFIEGDFFLAASLSTTLSKVLLRYSAAHAGYQEPVNRFSGEVLFLLSSMIHFGKSGLCKSQITEDDIDRISTAISLIADKWPEATGIFVTECRDSLDQMLTAKGDSTKSEDAFSKSRKANIVEADKTIAFTQLSTLMEGLTGTNLFDLSLSQALGTSQKSQKFDFASSKLAKVVQLAGLSDPVYAEAYVNVNQYDIVLDVLIVNQTGGTLQNVSLELSTIGDLKLVDKPSPITLAPNDFANIKATVKVASTENAVIFSTIAYDVHGPTSDRNCVYLQDIHVDIMDYIVPGSCSDYEFCQMWPEFEWENKVIVNTPITDLREYLDHISKKTNMKLLTADAALDGDCGIMAANFCAHSIFGEDSLANVSIEKSVFGDTDSPIVGHIRIRAKSQGMALALGDKINAAQKERSYVSAQMAVKR